MPLPTKLVMMSSALQWLRRNSRSFFGSLAFWSEPIPHDGEKKSSFCVRQVLFALGWFGGLLVVYAGGFLLSWCKPEFVDSNEFIRFFFDFGLPFFAGIVLLFTLLAGVIAYKAAVFGPNPKWMSNDRRWV